MIQSLLTQQEYDNLSKKYNTYNTAKRRAAKPIRLVKIDGKEFQCGPPPNYIMGNALIPSEIKLINDRLEAVLKKHGLI